MKFIAPYPSLYNLRSAEFESALRRLVEGYDSEHELAFFPIEKILKSDSSYDEIESKLEIEIQSNKYKFRDVEIDGWGKAKALCRINSRPWGMAPPDRCVVTRVQRGQTSYVLGINRIVMNYENSCPTGRSIVIKPLFNIANVNDRNDFVREVLINLAKGKISIDSNRIDVRSNTNSVVLIGAAGPRLSKISKGMNEQIDLTLIMESSASSEVSVSEPNSYVFKAIVSGWINRQRTSSPDNWFMPDDNYHSAFEDELSSTLRDSYSSFCRNKKKHSVTEIAGTSGKHPLELSANRFVCK